MAESIMKRLREFLYDLLIWIIIIVVFVCAILGMIAWKVFKSEWMLMGIDRFVLWLDKVLKLNEVKE